MAIDLPKCEKFVERTHRNYRDRFTVVWMVTRACNFKCEYCYQPDGLGNVFDVNEFITRLKLFPQPVRLLITGGEPLLFPWLSELCRKVGEMGGIVGIQTNFSVHARKFTDAMRPEWIEVIEVSYHPRQREIVVQDGIRKLIEDVSYARSKGFNVTVWHIDYPKLTPDEFLRDCDVLNAGGIVPIRKRYCGDYGGRSWPGDAIEVCGRRCLAGCFGACMWENFDLTVCDHDRTKLGNLFDGWNLFDAPMPCAKPFCGCLGREWIVEKFHDDFYGRDFGGDNDA